MYISTRPPDKGKWAKLFAKQRNWLLIWRMSEKGIKARELAEKAGCSYTLILRLMAKPGSVPNEEAMKSICRILQSNPCDLGWGRKYQNVHTPYRMDIGPFYEALNTMLKFSLHCSSQFEMMKKKLDLIYHDYCDRMMDENPAPVVEKNLSEPFLETEARLKEVLGNDVNVEDW